MHVCVYVNACMYEGKYVCMYLHGYLRCAALQSVEPNPPCYLLLDSLDAQLPVRVCTYIYMYMCNIYIYLRMYVCSSAVR